MSEYLDIYSFSVDSRKELAELKIVPSQRPPSICAQVHQLENDSYWLFWNKGLTTNDYFNKCNEFAREKGILEGLKKLNAMEAIEEIERQAEFESFIKQFVPVKKRQLSDDDMAIVWDFLDHDFGPSGKSKTCGLDGHRYFFKIFGETVGTYETWCKVPDTWEPLIPFVNLIIDITEIENRLFYEPINGRPSGQRYCTPIEIPPWMRAKED